MDHTLKYEEHKRFLVIPEEYLLEWVYSYSQEQIDKKESVLYTVRTLQAIHEDSLLVIDDEIVLSEENPGQEKFKQWLNNGSTKV
jgi:uncharacterized membrane protein